MSSRGFGSYNWPHRENKSKTINKYLDLTKEQKNGKHDFNGYTNFSLWAWNGKKKAWEWKTEKESRPKRL